MTESITNQLLALRPEIQSEPAHTIAEIFQNETLRPILKLQNVTLIRVFRNYINKHKNQFDKLNVSQKQLYVTTSLRQDNQLRHFIRGIVAGLFTEDEWEIFLLQESELSSRMIKLTEQRLISQLDKLSE